MATTPAGRFEILIVEDDSDSRETLADLLDLEGYLVDCAANGREALDRLQKGPLPCLILTDLNMPVLSGWEFLRAVKQDPLLSSVPVAVVSAMADRRGVNALEGAVACLAKPFRPSELFSLVARYCERAA
jgi:CheY-like chemotaxis protein